MTELQNPFVYDAASTLAEDQILQYYIDDHNYSRLIQSKRNVFLIGERGSGKTMTLLFNTARIQQRRAERDDVPFDLEYVGVLVPCNTPLTHKREYQLLDEFRAGVLSEHFFALAIAYEIAATLEGLAVVVSASDSDAICDELEFVVGLSIPKNRPLFTAIREAIRHEAVVTQRRVNDPSSSLFYDRSLSFATLVIPLLESISRLERLRESHFLLMIDDAHDLNEYQIRALNSWIAYRQRSLFSFKVATAKIGRPSRRTASGGSILEFHDFITIDLEQPIHNEDSAYGKLADKIVRRRLDRVGVTSSVDEFFPEHPEFARGLRQAEERVRAEALTLYNSSETKRISDFVGKYRRVEYFRTRDPKANLPHYNGFSTLVYVSTGVVRNLLEPCWWMYDASVSALPQEQRVLGCIQSIDPAIQTKTILDRSKAAWDRLDELDQLIEGCSKQTAQMVRQLFDGLAKYFRERLLHHKTEPGAISFSISQRSPEMMNQLDPILDIARRAQMLYVREGPAKRGGGRESYYVPNRILWPIRGLDPHGQHARASLRAAVLYRAALGEPIPFDAEELDQQQELFDVES